VLDEDIAKLAFIVTVSVCLDVVLFSLAVNAGNIEVEPEEGRGIDGAGAVDGTPTLVLLTSQLYDTVPKLLIPVLLNLFSKSTSVLFSPGHNAITDGTVGSALSSLGIG